MYKVCIRKNETGEERIRTMKTLNWKDHSLFWWTEGNFGCDCNRELEWHRAGGEEIDLDDAKCSDGRFAVLWAELPSGERIPIDEKS